VSARLIVFTRYPVAGRVKTRLIPVLGAEKAAELHSRLTAHTLAWAASWASEQMIRLEVHFDGGNVQLMTSQFGEGLAYVPQVNGDLGDRLMAATSEIAEPTVVIGTDCPDLGPQISQQAFRALKDADVVLGPAADGGYYLIGFKRPMPYLFAGIPWGSDQVARLTQQRAVNGGLSVALIDRLVDVDRPEDLEVLHDRFEIGFERRRRR
jgi:rSAM/selenodomain-associated transferase 1